MEEHFRVARKELRLDFFVIADNAKLTEDPIKRRFYMRELEGPRGASDGRSPETLDSLIEFHRISKPDWQKLQRLVRDYYEPYNFVTFLAYEWCSATHGDHNVYYFNDDEPIRLPSNLPDLYKELSETRCMIIPHHSGYALGRRGVNWNYHNPRLERLVEIFSLHGSSEEPQGSYFPLKNIGMGTNVPGGSVQEILNRGYKLGIMASSDCHEDPHQLVLTGVYSEELTREKIWQGLWDRHCFGTTGEKIEIKFSMDDYPMGSIYATDTFPGIKISIQGTRRIQRVDLIKNGGILKSWEVNKENATFQMIDETTPSKPDNYYYVRVLQENGSMGWSSPIWVSYLPELEPVRGYLFWEPEFELLFTAKKKGSKMTLICTNESLEHFSARNIRFQIFRKTTSEKLFGAKFPKLNSEHSISVEFFLKRNQRVYSDLVCEVSYRDFYDNLRHIRRTMLR